MHCPNEIAHSTINISYLSASLALAHCATESGYSRLADKMQLTRIVSAIAELVVHLSSRQTHTDKHTPLPNASYIHVLMTI